MRADATVSRPARRKAADAALTVGACITGALLAASLLNAVVVVAKARSLVARPQMVAVGHSLKLGGCDSTHRCAAPSR